MVALIAALEHRVPFCERDWHRAASEYRAAMELSASQRSLDVDDSKRVFPCSDVMNTMVRCLVGLFGPAIGRVLPHVSIENLATPALKRKALVLATSGLVTNALIHGFARCSASSITVSLCRAGPARARLMVSDDGRSVQNDRQLATCSAIFDLANLLESEVVYCEREGGGTVAEIGFQVPTQTHP
jgi:hypothetical protein